MTHKFTRDQYYEKGAAIFQRFRTALTIALSLLSTSSWAVVTYDGTDGVLANIFNSNSQQACTGCHSSALAGVDRNSATVGVDFNTYALATSIVADLNFDGFTNGDDRNAVRASIRVDQGTMPLDINTLGALPLNSTEKALIAQWITDGYPQNAAPEMTTSAATSVGKYSATLNGTVKENGANTTVSFKYDTNSPPTSFTKSVTSPSGSGGGTTADSISGSITSLSCGTLYYFRSVGTNSVGTVNGSILNFTTSACNVAPTITSTAGTSATEDVQYSYQVAVTDPDDSNNGTDLSFSLSNQPAGMSVSSTGLITWTPTEGVTTSGTVTVTVQDGGEDGAAADTENFTVSVTAVNDSPQITSTAGTSATEDTQYSYQVTVTDPDDSNNGTDLSFALTNEPSGMVVSSTGLITWTPVNGVTTSGTVTVTVTDGGEDSATGDTENFTVSVTAVNDPPTITSTAGTSATEDVQYSYQVAVTDVDDSNNGTDLSFSLSNQPTGMVVSSTGLITWTPSEGVTTSGVVTVTVQDGGENGATADTENFTVSVTAVNDSPKITSTAGTSATEDVQYSYQVAVTDPDDTNNGTDLSFSLTNQPTGMVVSSTGLITWTPTNGVTTSGSVTVTVNDGGENSATGDSETFTVAVTAVNDSPSITSSAGTSATEDVQYSYQVAVTDVDDSNNGTDLTFSLSNQPTGMVVSSTGLVTWTPLEGVTTSGLVTVTVQDGGEDGATSDSENFTVSVTAVNDAPQITSTPSTSATEDVQYSYQVSVSDPDDSNNGTDISFALSNQPSGMVVSSTGLVTWTPTNGVTTSGQVTVTVSDGGEDGAVAATQNWTVTVGGVNDAPTITSTAGTTATEDVLYSYQVAVTDPDDSNNGTDLTFSLVNEPTGMTVSSTGLIQWTPVEGQLTSGSVTVSVADGGENGALPDSEVFTVTVTPVNDSPQITSAPSTSAIEDNLYSYQVVTADPDDANNGTDLSFVLSNQPTGMTVNSTGLISWTPTNGVISSGEVTITVTDGGEDGAIAATQSWTVSVDGVNDPPVITSTATTTAIEDVLYQYQVLVTDPDDVNNGTDLTFSLTNAPVGMTVSSTGLVEWIPFEGQLTSDSVTVTVADGGESGALPDSETFTVLVTPVNDAPLIASAASTSATEDVEYRYQVVVIDPDDDNNGTDLTYVLTNAPSGMVVSNTGLITWTPSNGVTTSGAVTITVSDGGEDGAVSDAQNWTVTVDAVNDAPVISSTASTSAIEDILYSYQVQVTDPDDSNNGTDLSFSLTNAPTGMSVSTTGLVTWTPLEGQLTSGDVTLTVSDGGENNAQPDAETFTVLVTSVNDSPVITSTAVTSATEDTQYSYQVTVVDPDDANDGSSLTFALSGEPTGMTVSSTGLITWTPEEGTFTSGQVTVIVADGGEDGASSDAQAWTVTVTTVNDSPVITSTAGTQATEDELYSYQLVVNDPDDSNNGTDLTFSLSGAPTGMTVSDTGLISWTPVEGQLSSGQVSISVSDGGEDGSVAAVEQFTVTVTPVDDAPTITSTAITMATEDVAYQYDVDATDPENSVLAFSLSTAPVGMSIDDASGVISWTPLEGVVLEAVTVLVSDGVNTDSQSFSVAVTPVNDPPVFTSSPVTVATEDIEYSYTLTASDVENDGLTFSLISGPSGMSLSSSNQLTWTATEGVLTEAVTVQVTDGEFNVTQSFSISVIAVNDGVSVTALSDQAVTELSTWQVSIVVSDPDDVNDGSSIRFQLISAPTGMDVSSTGVLSWTPGEDTRGSYSPTVRVSDGLEDGAQPVDMTFNLTVNILDSDSDGVADYSDNCVSDANSDQLDTDNDTVGNVCDSDDDNDGIPDDVEQAAGLDSLDASDATGDLDSDGIDNVSEYLNCSAQSGLEASTASTSCVNAMTTDSVPPEISLVSPLLVDSVDYLTPISPEVTALDGIDGEVSVSLASGNLSLRPGIHELVWQAMDQAGNRATRTQVVHVRPQVVFGGSKVIGEGSSAGESQSLSIPVSLSGDAVTYPVTITLEVNEEASEVSGNDYALASNEVVIERSLMADFSISILNDGISESDEMLVLQVVSVSSGAVISDTTSQYRVLIVDRNVAPDVSLTLQQGGQQSSTLYQDAGLASLNVLASDANQDVLSVTWQLDSISAALTASTSNVNETIIFDPALLTVGELYQVMVTVSDGESTTQGFQSFVVAAQLPNLQAGTDSDGDGIDDQTEGLSDSDGDGVPDYQDAVNDPTRLSAGTDGGETTDLMATESGLQMSMGSTALSNGQGGALIRSDDITDGSGVVVEDGDYAVVGGLYDFVVKGLTEANRVAKVVIPLAQSVPAGASYRKFSNGEWYEFIENGTDFVESANKVEGLCPPPGSESYQLGLLRFADCVQLNISDGGPNDADGEINGVIVDPSGVGAIPSAVSNPELVAPTSQPNGSGGAVDKFVLMVLFGLLWLKLIQRWFSQRRFYQQTMHLKRIRRGNE